MLEVEFTGTPIAAEDKAKRGLLGRNKSLDVLRAIAVLLVMFTHLHLLSKQQVTGFSKLIRLSLVWGPRGGWIGVDLFFVLSGFLVAGLLFSEYKKSSNIHVGRFLLRRGFKIYPNFIFFIITAFLLERLVLNMHYPVSLYIKDLFFIHNYFGGRFGHTWSLDVEEFFYFFLVAYLLVLVRFKKVNLRNLIITDIVLIVLGVTARFINNIKYPVLNFNMHYEKTHFRLESLFLGVVLSYLYHYNKDELFTFSKRWKKQVFLPIILLLLIPFIVDRAQNHWISVVFLSIMPFSFCTLIILALQSDSAFFNNRVLSFLGTYSYGIYLWHFPIQEWLLPASFNSQQEWLVYAISYFSLSIILGILSTYVVEKPFLKIRDRLFPSKSLGSV